jgi:hypothetical protein
MSVIAFDEPPGAGNGAAKRGSFWQRLAQAIDEYCVDRTRRAIPETTLRRSRHEINRCRRLMHRSSLAPVGANIDLASRHRITRAQPQ